MALKYKNILLIYTYKNFQLKFYYDFFCYVTGNANQFDDSLLARTHEKAFPHVLRSALW